MKFNQILLVAIVAIITLVSVSPVIAETYTGQFLIPSQTTSILMPQGASVNGNTHIPVDHLYFSDIGLAQGLTSIIYEVSGNNGFDYHIIADTGKSSDTIPFTSPIGNGFIQYQRLYNTVYPYEENAGWLAVVFDAPLNTTLTGTQKIIITPTSTVLFNAWSTYVPTGTRFVAIGDPTDNGVIPSSYTAVAGDKDIVLTGQDNYNDHFLQTFSLDYPSGLGGSFSVDKKGYNSKITVYRYSDSNVLFTEPSTNNINIQNASFLNNAQPFLLSCLSNQNTVINSTVYPPSAANNSYSLSFSPTNPSSNQLISQTIQSNNQTPGGSTLSELKFISMSEVDSSGNTLAVINSAGNSTPQLTNPLSPNGINLLKNSNGYWNAYTPSGGYSTPVSSITPNPVSFSLFTSGTHYIKTVIIDQNNYETDIITPITVTGVVGNIRLTIYPVDSVTSSIVTGAHLHVKNLQSGTFVNKTISTITDCVFIVSPGWYGFYVDPVTGYSTTNTGAMQDVYVTEDQTNLIVLTPATSGLDITNTSLTVTVTAGSSYGGLGGALVNVPGIGSKYTNTLGSAQFTVVNGTTYNIGVTANGYQSVTDVFTPTGSEDYFSVHLESGTIPTLTPIPTTYPGQTPSVYPTVNGTVSNEGFFGNAVGWLTYMGAKPTEVSVVLTFLIILIGGVLGSAASSVGLGYQYQPSPTGALLGAVAGFVADVAFGFIPAWIVIIGALLLILIAALRTWQ